MIDPPKVLLEHSFLQAVADDQHDQHERATSEYLRLVAEYELEAVLLVAVSDHLRAHCGFDRRGRFAPVDRLWVGRQHRRAAKRTPTGGDLDLALTLVMAQRHRVRTIATLDPRFGQYQLTLLPADEVE